MIEGDWNTMSPLELLQSVCLLHTWKIIESLWISTVTSRKLSADRDIKKVPEKVGEFKNIQIEKKWNCLVNSSNKPRILLRNRVAWVNRVHKADSAMLVGHWLQIQCTVLNVPVIKAMLNMPSGAQGIKCFKSRGTKVWHAGVF